MADDPKDKGFLETIESDAKKAGVRLVGDAYTETTKAALAKMLADDVDSEDPGLAEKFVRFLNKPLGDALYRQANATAMFFGKKQLPEKMHKPVEALREELSVSGIAAGGGILAKAFLGPLKKAGAAMLEMGVDFFSSDEEKTEEKPAKKEKEVPQTVGVGSRNRGDSDT